SAHADLEEGQVERPAGEGEERGPGHGLEVRQRDRGRAVRGGEDLSERGIELVGADVVGTDSKALGDAFQVRRRVEPGGETRGAGDGVERGRGRPLPVRAGHEDRGNRPLGTPEPLADGVDRLETEPDSPLAEGLEAGEVRETGGVRDAQSGYAAGRPSHIR